MKTLAKYFDLAIGP